MFAGLRGLNAFATQLTVRNVGLQEIRIAELCVRRVSVAEIRLQEGESLENALRRFKRKVQTEDIIKEVKRHSYYLKPGEKRRVKQALARKRARKKNRKEGSFAKDSTRQ
jgi:small subunit ribosomal protein S21